MSKSQTIIDPEWLHNSHAGELLVSDFMEPLGLTAESLASSLDISTARLVNVVAGSARIDADLDLRLGRFFRMSEGFFLRLQDQHDLLEAKRALKGDLERITPLAA